MWPNAVHSRWHAALSGFVLSVSSLCVDLRRYQYDFPIHLDEKIRIEARGTLYVRRAFVLVGDGRGAAGYRAGCRYQAFMQGRERCGGNTCHEPSRWRKNSMDSVRDGLQTSTRTQRCGPASSRVNRMIRAGAA
ncbi:hypothetical protein [Paraburkholderia terrae]|uniref:hypothetical protein n=1 Tax=Paraburkholderia terrae TaxID=311230 RepID=UPI0012E03C0B